LNLPSTVRSRNPTVVVWEYSSTANSYSVGSLGIGKEFWPAGQAHCAWGDHFVIGNPLRVEAPVGRYERIFLADHREAQGEAGIQITK
jgi:hypothetical protein